MLECNEIAADDSTNTGAYEKSHISCVKTRSSFVEGSCLVLTMQVLGEGTRVPSAKGYRSVGSMLSALKHGQTLRGHSWDVHMGFISTEGRRAGRRRLGAPRKAKPYRIQSIFKIGRFDFR